MNLLLSFNTCFMPCFCFFTFFSWSLQFQLLLKGNILHLLQHHFTRIFSLCLFFLLASFTKRCEPLKISHHRVCLIIKISYVWNVQRRIASISIFTTFLMPPKSSSSGFYHRAENGEIKKDFSPNHKIFFPTSSRRSSMTVRRSTGPKFFSLDAFKL